MFERKYQIINQLKMCWSGLKKF